MRQNTDEKTIRKLSFLAGDADILRMMPDLPAKEPFSEQTIEFLNDVSRALLLRKDTRDYPDVTAFAFWIRKASVIGMKERFCRERDGCRLGRGVVFHIAPSNVAVNYAYSLAAGLLTGNRNIVRLPSRDFPQVRLINEEILPVLERHDMAASVCLVRYGRDREVNDLLSRLCDVRVIWGGDATVREIRQSPLTPRAGEVTFADRFSLAVIDSDRYLEQADKGRIAERFYNDTYLTDQNACTSPRMVVWMGGRKKEAAEVFWDILLEKVKREYAFQPIQGIDKLSDAYMAAVQCGGVQIMPSADNRLVRVRVSGADSRLMDWKGNSGFFYEYDCGDILELKEICGDKRCQTIAYIGEREMLAPLIRAGVKGVDRIVPVGQTMDFDLIWDGYDLCERLTRIVRIL